MSGIRFPDAILAVDPGVTVGLAQLNGSPKKRSSYKGWRVKLGPWPKRDDDEPPKDPVLDEIHAFCKFWRPEQAIVICERFTTAQRQNKYGRFTNELIGSVEGVCYVYDIPFVPVKNSSRINYRTQAETMLKKKHNPIHDDDDVAAMSHLLAFIARITQALA